MATDMTPKALRALVELEAMARGRRADWLSKDDPLYKWVGYHQHNGQIAWKVFADHIQVFLLGTARAQVMSSRARFQILQRNHAQAIPAEQQVKVEKFIEQLPRSTYAQALDAATQLTRDPGVAKYLHLEEEAPSGHAPQRFPVLKIELATRDGELVATNREFKVIIREKNDVTYRAAVKGDLEIALNWTRQNQKRIPMMRGREIIDELRKLGFKGSF